MKPRAYGEKSDVRTNVNVIEEMEKTRPSTLNPPRPKPPQAPFDIEEEIFPSPQQSLEDKRNDPPKHIPLKPMKKPEIRTPRREERNYATRPSPDVRNVIDTSINVPQRDLAERPGEERPKREPRHIRRHIQHLKMNVRTSNDKEREEKSSDQVCNVSNRGFWSESDDSKDFEYSAAWINIQGYSIHKHDCIYDILKYKNIHIMGIGETWKYEPQ